MIQRRGTGPGGARNGRETSRLKIAIYLYAAIVLISLVGGIATGNFQLFGFLLVLALAVVASWIWSVLVDRAIHKIRAWNKAHSPQPVSGVPTKGVKAATRYSLRNVSSGPVTLNLPDLVGRSVIPPALASEDSSDPFERIASLKLQASSVLSRLAEELEQAGKKEDAERIWAEVKAYDPINKPASDRVNEDIQERAPDATSHALNLLRAGKFEEAREALNALGTKNASGAVIYGRAVCQAYFGETDEAAESFRQAADAGAESAHLRLALGIALADQGDYKGAVRQLKAAVTMDDSIAEAYAALADVQLQLEEVDEARDSINEALSLDSEMPIAHLILGRILYQRGDAAGACREIERALKADPDNLDILYNLACALSAAQRYDELVSRIEPVATISDDPHLAQLLGEAYEKLGKSEKAREYLSKTVELLPGSEEARVKLVRSLREEGKLQEAQQMAEELVRENPRSAETMTELGLVVEEQGDEEKALNHFRTAIQLDKNNSIALTEAGRLLVKFGQLKEGMNYLRQAATQPAATSDTYYWLGEAQLQSGKALLAIDSLREASRLESSRRGEISYALGRALLQAGRAKDALDELRRARKMLQNHAELERDLGYALHKTRNYQEALRCFRQYLQMAPEAKDAAEVKRLAEDLASS